MKFKSLWGILILGSLLAFAPNLWSQSRTDSNLVQFSGLVLDGSNGELVPVPYTNIFIKGKGRGTYSDLKGFFSIVAEKGDVIRFSTIGYKTVEYVIPMDLNDDRYSLVQLMTQDVVNLPETVIFPWPSRDHFRLEFLAMDVTPELQKRAAENIAEESLKKAEAGVRYDGDENADFYLRKQASNYYYNGQAPPMNIFNPIAWGKFFKAWKNGDFKKKE
jgi:CarboxypepD_reg-like domain